MSTESTSIKFYHFAPLSRKVFAPCFLMLLLLAAVFAAGCSSLNKPNSVSFASVIINRTYTVAQIQQAALTVFQRDGYQVVLQPDDTLVFEREATRGEQFSYGGFVGAHEGDKVVIQVRLNIQVRNAATYWLGCKAYAVVNSDTPTFATTTALFNFQSGPYQKLLDKVKGTVQQPVVTP